MLHHPNFLLKIAESFLNYENSLEFFIFLLKKQDHKSEYLINLVMNTPNFRKRLTDYALKIMHDKGNYNHSDEQIFPCGAKELFTFFKGILASGHLECINLLWSDKTLALYLCGYPVRTQVANQDGIIIEQTKQLNKKQLIAIFTATLLSNSPVPINEMWGTAESPLQQTLTSLNSIELAELTEKILLCPHSVTFIKPFLLTLSEHLISGLWNKLPSFPMPNRVVFMEVLENTLTTLLNNAKNTANNVQQKTMQENVKQNPPLSSSDNYNNFFKNPEQKSHRDHEEKAVHPEPNPLVKNKS